MHLYFFTERVYSIFSKRLKAAFSMADMCRLTDRSLMIWLDVCVGGRPGGAGCGEPMIDVAADHTQRHMQAYLSNVLAPKLRWTHLRCCTNPSIHHRPQLQSSNHGCFTHSDLVLASHTLRRPYRLPGPRIITVTATAVWYVHKL